MEAVRKVFGVFGGVLGTHGRGLRGKFNFVDTYVTTYYKPLPPKKYFPCTPYLFNKMLFSVSSQQKTRSIF
jgi:hypothetical protein